MVKLLIIAEKTVAPVGGLDYADTGELVWEI
jgi:hypothetical protein